ncbi:MAG: carboxypeptidase regulatory-like domain-containing protein, partial [Bryobacterales bacterium]|nr:carboxypeptidase regulatory-like domain-containing protein [Bryobacterales bacterium]
MIHRCSLIFVVFSFICSAQTTTAVIFGELQDSSHRPISGATVVAEDPSRGFRRATVSDASGAYRLAELPPGAYQLSASRAELQTVTVPGITLSVDTRLRQD